MRRTTRFRITSTLLGTAALAACAATAQDGEVTTASRNETQPPFSGPANQQYAQAVWAAMTEADLVGEGGIVTYPYTGQEPHGRVLEYLEKEITVDGRDVWTLVKRNHLAEDLEIEDVINEPRANLDSVTVMVRREAGYDPDNQNWWWAKYNPDGSLQLNPNDMELAGRVAKGADAGCIACHQAAPGGDYIFGHDRQAP